MTIHEVVEALRFIADVLENEEEVLDDCQQYGHTYGGQAGANVFELVLRDALRMKGLTLEQFRAERAKKR